MGDYASWLDEVDLRPGRNEKGDSLAPVVAPPRWDDRDMTRREPWFEPSHKDD